MFRNRLSALAWGVENPSGFPTREGSTEREIPRLVYLTRTPVLWCPRPRSRQRLRIGRLSC